MWRAGCEISQLHRDVLLKMEQICNLRTRGETTNQWRAVGNDGHGNPHDIYFGGVNPIKKIMLKNSYVCIEIQALANEHPSKSRSWLQASTSLCMPVSKCIALVLVCRRDFLVLHLVLLLLLPIHFVLGYRTSTYLHQAGPSIVTSCSSFHILPI